jgi:ankyrin repeat protein
MENCTLAERLKRKLPMPFRSKDQKAKRVKADPIDHVAQPTSDCLPACATASCQNVPQHLASDGVAAPDERPTCDGTIAVAVPNAAARPPEPNVGPSKPTSPSLPTEALISSKYLWEKAAEALRADKEWEPYRKILREKNLPVPGELANTDIQSTAAATNPSDMPASITAAAEEVKVFYEHNRHVKIGDKIFMVGEACDKVIAGLSAIKDLGAAATRLNPYASTAWGVIQFVIQVFINRRETLELCWAELPRITRLVSRYQTFEILYQQVIPISKVILEESLIDLYKSLLKYQIVIVIYTASKTARFEAVVKDKSKSAVQSLLEEIKKQEEEVGRLEALVNHEIECSNWNRVFQVASESQAALDTLDGSLADVSSRLELLGLSLKTILTGLGGVSQKVDFMYREKIIQWISPIKYENTHNLPRKTAIPATGQWLINHNKLYKNWKSSEDSSTFLLHGFMGSGKSCLAHAVIEDLKSTLQPDNAELLAYFYCDSTNNEGRSQIESATNILRSFLKQLSRPAGGGFHAAAVVEAYEENSHKADLTEERTVYLIGHVVQNSNCTILVIDGLDECPLQVQIDLIRNLKEFVGLRTKNDHGVKLFISSRHTQLIEDSLYQFKPSPVDAAKHNQGDISKLIHLRVDEAADHPHLRRLYWRKGVSRKSDVVEKLEQNAQGMFRWVQLALDYIHSSQKYETFTQRLVELERLKSLFALYDVLYNDMIENSTYQELEAIEVLLIFLLYGERRLGRNESQGHCSGTDSILSPMSEAIAFRRNPGCVDDSNLLAIEDLMVLCPNFVTLDCPNDFLQTANRQTADHSTNKHSSLVLIEAQVDRADKNMIAWDTAPFFIRKSNRQREKRWQGLGIPHFTVREYLVARHPAKYSFFQGQSFLAQLCIDVFSHPDVHLRVPENSLVDYAGRNWAVHLSAIQRDSPGPRGLQPGARGLEVALEQSLPLQIKVDAFLCNSETSQGFINWTSWFNTRWTTGDYYSKRSMAWMAVFRTRLLRSRKDPSRTIFSGPTFASVYLHYRCQSLKMMPPLRSRLYEMPHMSLSKRHVDVLEYAVMIGNTDAINALFQSNQSIHRPSRGGEELEKLYYWPLKFGSLSWICLRRPVPWSYMIDHYDAVDVLGTLAMNGVDPNFSDVRGRTPLCWTLDSTSDRSSVECRLNLAKLLLKKGADPNIMSSDGLTPLQQVVSTSSVGIGRFCSIEQRLSIVKALIEHGADCSAHCRSTGSNVLQWNIRTDCTNNLAIIEYLSPLTLGKGMATNEYFHTRHEDFYETLFHKIVIACSEDTIRCWINHGANPYAPTITCVGKANNGLPQFKYGWTAIDLARDIGRSKIVDYLSSILPSTAVVEPTAVPNCEYCKRYGIGYFYPRGVEYVFKNERCIYQIWPFC